MSDQVLVTPDGYAFSPQVRMLMSDRRHIGGKEHEAVPHKSGIPQLSYHSSPAPQLRVFAGRARPHNGVPEITGNPDSADISAI